VGAAVDRDGAWDAIVRLAEMHGALVWVSPLIGRSSFPEDHRLFAGFLPAFREEIHARLGGHDVLVAFGAPLFTYHAEGQGPYLPEALTAFQVTEDPEMAAGAISGHSMVGSVGLAIHELLMAGRGSPPAQQAGRVPAPRLVAVDPLTDEFLMQTIADLRAPDSIIVEEAPSSRSAMHRHLPILRSETFYTCSSGGLGHAMPAAVGVALGRPGARIIALIGDGSAMYSIQALWSAAQHGLPVTFIIVNNRRYKALDVFSQRFGVAQAVGTTLGGIDFVQLARSLGCDAARVDQAASLRSALESALACTGPMLLDVQVL